ncbi:TPA: DUF1566 domain-containing protein [Vibrio parahaemolyticus]|nr:DUF1566 domain-containing protein [Vibrio parahaemolyticus]
MNYSCHNSSFFLLFGLLLTGCGSEDSGSRTALPPTQEAPNSPQSTAIKNISKIVYTNQANTIRVARNNNERIKDIKLINKESKDCYNFDSTEHALILSPTVAGNCVYYYETELINGETSQEGTLHLAKFNVGSKPGKVKAAINPTLFNTTLQNKLNLDAPLLPIDSYAVQRDDIPLFVDLNEIHADKIDNGYSIDSIVLINPLEEGAVFDAFDSSFRFTTTNDTQLGVYRVYYGLTNGSDTYLGQVDITVGSKNNKGISVLDYHHSNVLEMNETATINLTDLSSLIVNEDADELEIVQVAAINSDAVTDGTSITFSAPLKGDYSISYLLTDNRGAYVLGNILFSVKGPFESVATPFGVLMPPITLAEAIEVGFDYSTPNVDTKKNVEMATFTYETAKAICKVYGAVLPTLELTLKLDELGYTEKFYTLWPYDKPYVLNDQFVDEIEGSYYYARRLDSYKISKLRVGDGDNVPETAYLACFSPVVPFNDTGQELCLNSARAKVNCSETDVKGLQDGHLGRDAFAREGKLLKVGNGKAGFDFTKIGADGKPLPDSAQEWSCVRDNVTGLLWEVKEPPGSGGLRDANHTYSWYSTDQENNAGNEGVKNNGVCSGSSCDTEGYVTAVRNTDLCNTYNWRLPTANELFSLVHYGSKEYIAIDLDYFPHTQEIYYTSTASELSTNVTHVNFNNIGITSNTKGNKHSVRLVSSPN